MAGIRKVDTPKVPQTSSATQAEPKPLSASELSQVLAKAFDDGKLHGNELRTIEDVLRRAGPLKDDLLRNLERRLADPNLKVTTETLDKLKALGVDTATAAANQKRNADLRTQQQLGQTDHKTVADKVSGQAASTNQTDKQAAILASHDGRAVAKNELTPEFKLAKQLTGQVLGQIWSDKAPPELKAVQEAIGPQVSALASQTAMSVLSDPNAMANIAQLATKLGTDGFKAALAASTKDIASHFLNTAGVQAKNPEALKAALQGIEQLAPKLGGSLGPKVAETASKLAPKLLGDAAKAGTAAATAATAAKTAATAAQVGGAGAKVATSVAGGAAATAAKAGGQALPVIGNIISVGSTLLAGANFVAQLMKKPPDVEKILKEGVNTLAQGVGIAFPWVALGGTLVDAAWAAKLSVSDQKKAAQGIPVTENANVAAALPLLSDSADLLRAALLGAGKTDAAEKVASLVATTKTMAQLDLNKPGDRLSLLRKDEQQALIALAHESRAELDKIAAAETGTRKEALLRLASGFGALADTTLAASRYDKREGQPGFDDKAKKDLETKRNELAGNLLRQLGELGAAELLRRAEAGGGAQSA